MNMTRGIAISMGSLGAVFTARCGDAGKRLTEADGPLPASPMKGEVKSRGSVFDCAW